MRRLIVTGLAVALCGVPRFARAEESIHGSFDFDCEATAAYYFDDQQDRQWMTDALARNDWAGIRREIWGGGDPEWTRGTRWYEPATREGIQAALVKAAAAGDDAGVRRAIKQGANVNQPANLTEYATALIWAAGCNHLSTVQLLIDRGADVNLQGVRTDRDNPFKGTYGDTALMKAAFSGNVEVVKLLLKNGADPNAQFYTTRDFTVGPEKWDTPLLSAGTAAVAKLLLEHGADPNRVRSDGSSPLMEVAGLGKADWCKLLLEHGADPSAKNWEGDTASDIARKAKHPDVADLIDHWKPADAKR